MSDYIEPGLFGLSDTNRDFTKKSDWGKNVFNNAFPASLLCYMDSRNILPVYLKLDASNNVIKSYIETTDVLGARYSDIYFMFEAIYPPYEEFVTNHIPRTDLVTFRKDSSGLPTESLQDIEIKLTAVPDHVTSSLPAVNQGPEIVVRPDTIVYLAMSIITKYVDNRTVLKEITQPILNKVSNWNSEEEVRPVFDEILRCLESVMQYHLNSQQPILIQPIWRTIGKSLELADGAFDLFVWSDFAFARLFMDQAKRLNGERFTRFQRSVVWLFRMIADYSKNGQVNHSAIIRNINFGSQTDKAFAANGRITSSYLSSPELLNPRIKKYELPNIILNKGYDLLSPERRFDASVVSNISLFDR